MAPYSDSPYDRRNSAHLKEAILNRRLTALGVAAAVLLTLAAACSDDDDGAETPAPSVANPTAAPTRTGDDGATIAPFSEGPGEGPEPFGKIIFYSFRDGDQEIYIMDVDGSNQTNLTNDAGEDFEPDASPDGSQIVFVSDRDGQANIWVMNSDGSDVRKLSKGSSGNLSPRWSPDGEKIAFSRSGTITVMDTDGNNERVVFEPEPETTAGPCLGPGFVGGWSPDSRRITYYSASVARGIAEVCIIDEDGGNLEVIVSDGVNLHAEPVWSPDGRYLAYRSIRDGQHEIYVYDLETRTEVRVTDDPGIDTEPDWSPDGEWIAIASFRIGTNEDIFIMRKDGSDVRRLTDNEAMEKYPIWAP